MACHKAAWLDHSLNGGCSTARDTRAFAGHIGLVPLTTPVSTPQSDGVAGACVRALKRDYLCFGPRPHARTVIEQLSSWLAHYNEVHPHRALGYRSRREYTVQPATPRQAFGGNNIDHVALAREVQSVVRNVGTKVVAEQEFR